MISLIPWGLSEEGWALVVFGLLGLVGLLGRRVPGMMDMIAPEAEVSTMRAISLGEDA